ncbi:hypothetical protein LPJ61_006698 [Coemansia biformis]|uniref:RRM domain-containing protein n=1 Tax=Coemansia biformis TaxID=1286918 RepID=A0A9W7XTR7_9FUNG|nr:hypothetical protein LPJ61_006698 [Coemansia biformis]
MKGARLVRDVVIKHSIEGVRNMDHSLRLLNHMKKFGAVTSFKFMRDPVTDERTGLAFASFLHYDSAAGALSQRRQTVEGLPKSVDTIEVTPFKKTIQDV